jgi:hypothetical protein
MLQVQGAGQSNDVRSPPQLRRDEGGELREGPQIVNVHDVEPVYIADQIGQE